MITLNLLRMRRGVTRVSLGCGDTALAKTTDLIMYSVVYELRRLLREIIGKQVS